MDVNQTADPGSIYNAASSERKALVNGGFLRGVPRVFCTKVHAMQAGSAKLPNKQSDGGGDGEVRFISRALLEHRKLPRLVRIFRTCQAVCIAVVISSMFAVLILRPPMAVMNIWLVAVTIPLLVAVFAVGLLTWRNYEHTAEIWAENVRGRGLDTAGLGWLIDIGTVRAIGAGKALFTAAMVVAVITQTIWP